MSLSLSLLRCCVSNVMSSANCSRIVLFGFNGSGISLMYKLNSVGESAEPCGTPACDVNWYDLAFLCIIWYFLSIM